MGEGRLAVHSEEPKEDLWAKIWALKAHSCKENDQIPKRNVASPNRSLWSVLVGLHFSFHSV